VVAHGFTVRFCQHTKPIHKSVHHRSRDLLGRLFVRWRFGLTQNPEKRRSLCSSHVAGLRVGGGAAADTQNPTAARRQSGRLCKKLCRRTKKKSINTAHPHKAFIYIFFLIRLRSAQSAFYLPSPPPTAIARRPHYIQH